MEVFYRQPWMFSSGLLDGIFPKTSRCRLCVLDIAASKTISLASIANVSLFVLGLDRPVASENPNYHLFHRKHNLEASLFSSK